MILADLPDLFFAAALVFAVLAVFALGKPKGRHRRPKYTARHK